MIERQNTDLRTAASVYYGKFNNAESRSYLAKLRKLGTWGLIAAELFQAAKAEDRSASYRGGTDKVIYSKCSEERCSKAITRLLEILASSRDVTWGWLPMHLNLHVLCIQTPVGQICRFVNERKPGPRFFGEWDYEGSRHANRILKLCDHLLLSSPPECTRSSLALRLGARG